MSELLSKNIVPAVSMVTSQSGASTRANVFGMRPMQERAFRRRGEQYLLIKSPPASGKSRALMFIALDKLKNQGLKQAIIVVPERSIGASFANEKLSAFGFFADWLVKPEWNLCNAPGIDEPKIAKTKVKTIGAFLQSDDQILVCTHASFRFAVDELGIAAFDHRVIAVDEFHHVSTNSDNRLGSQLSEIIARDKTHIVAMTGSYFRGDAEAVLSPSEEMRFTTVTYTYYEQLNGYEFLKSLEIAYYFYSESYLDSIIKVLDPALKTIVHIPNVNSRESTKQKHKEVDEIMHLLGQWQKVDEETGFHHIQVADGKIIKVADLVDDEDPTKRAKVLNALKDPAQKNNKDHVDIIIALGMAKEGFDWIWREHALTVGYRSSLTEIVQIIGRATRDAKGKEKARFTNLIAQVDASKEQVVEAINDTLKAIAASLLMEQVLAPRFEFTPKNTESRALEGFDYGENGYLAEATNIGVNQETGACHIEIKSLATPKSPEATRICQEDLNEVITAFVQDKQTLERGLFDQENTIPQEITILQMAKIVRERYPDLSNDDQEAVRQHAILALSLVQQSKTPLEAQVTQAAGNETNTAFVVGVRRFLMDVRELSVDLIDKINPFEQAYAVLARSMNEETLKQVEEKIAKKKLPFPFEEARLAAEKAVSFKQSHGRMPQKNASDPYEIYLAEGVLSFTRYKKQELKESNALANALANIPTQIRQSESLRDE